METKIDIRGIIRNTKDLNSPAGSMQELINLRKKYGAWRPILPKYTIKTSYAPSLELFIHTMDEFEYFISYNTDGTVKALTDQGSEVETLISLDADLDIKFNTLGYFLIINDRTNFVKYIFRCAPTENTKYTDVSNLPFLELTIASTLTAITISYNADVSNIAWQHNRDSFLAGWWLLEEDMRSGYPEYFEGYVFFKWAIELIDGTVLKHSLPVFLYNGLAETEFVDAVSDYITITDTLGSIGYTIQASLPSDWNNYKNLIRGISIFMSRPISKYHIDISGISENNTYIGLIEKPNLLIDLFRNESAYYRIHHIPFNKITGGGTGIIGTSKPISSSAGGGRTRGTRSPRNPTVGPIHRDRPSNLGIIEGPAMGIVGGGAIDRPYNPAEFNVNDIMSYEMMNVDDVSHHNLMGFRALNYNSRLFMGDIYTRLFDGFNISSLIKTAGGGAVTEFNVYIEVDLATDLGTRTVMQTMTWAEDAIRIPVIIGYPDFRATEMRIIHNSGGPLMKLTIALESHPSLNMATANKFDGADIAIQAKDATGYQDFDIADIDTAATLTTVNTSLRDKNRVQLTELYNPFITPAIYSYQVGEGNIVALGVNMIPLDDKFGAFPVYVFSSRGVWALNLSDTGAVVVSNIVPLSSSVCINSDSVVVVGNLLVFLASDGIKLLTGQNPAEISDLAEGPSTSILAGNSIYEEIKVQGLLNDVTNQISTTDLLTYAADAVFGYDKTLREIIVSNFDFGYSYIYSLDEKMWYKTSLQFKKFITNYPNLYALITGNDLVDLSSENVRNPDETPIYFESKPILLGPDKEIKISRLILGGLFDVSAGFSGALYVFGSNDSVTWSLITGKEITGANIYNIIIPRLPISLRYCILVFSGTLKQDSSLSEVRVIT